VPKLGESGPEAAKGGQERFAKENHKENGRVPRAPGSTSIYQIMFNAKCET